MVVVVLEVFSLLLFISDKIGADSFDGSLERPAAGEEPARTNLLVTLDEESKPVSVDVNAIAMTENEKKELIEAAKAEIDESFLASNPGLEAVSCDLNPKRSYVDDRVRAYWDFGNQELLDPNGRLHPENIKEDTLISANCKLSFEGIEEVYGFTFNLLAPATDTESGFNYLLGESLREADEKTADKEMLILPDKLDGKTITWSPADSQRALQLAIFGGLTGFVLLLAGKEDKKRKAKLRIKKMEEDYPEIVSMLSLYVGAGISVKSAFSRIAAMNNGNDTEERPGFVGVEMLKRDMDDGKGELDAYRDFGKRMGHKDYRKLSLLLSQNLRKGSDQLALQLEKEERQAFEDRKIRAKILGEEASTKLLLPMMGLLAIVMVVLVFPAMQGINI